MYRYRRSRYGPGFARPWRPLRSAIWLIGLGILFFWGHWWPGILVLIGLTMIVEALFRAPMRQWPQNSPPPASPVSPPAAPVPAPVQIDPVHRVELLPANCPQCGGPIRAHEVKWTGRQSAACPFCGTNLPMQPNR